MLTIVYTQPTTWMKRCICSTYSSSG